MNSFVEQFCVLNQLEMPKDLFKLTKNEEINIPKETIKGVK